MSKSVRQLQSGYHEKFQELDKLGEHIFGVLNPHVGRFVDFRAKNFHTLGLAGPDVRRGSKVISGLVLGVYKDDDGRFYFSVEADWTGESWRGYVFIVDVLGGIISHSNVLQGK